MIATLTFESVLPVDSEVAWRWITSLDGISLETRPILQMSSPEGVQDLSSVEMHPGVPMFRSWIRLFGVVPVDYSDLTLIEMTSGVGFIEASNMGSMRLWRHERRIGPLDAGCRITDTLTFQPRFAGWLVTRFVAFLFRHRHRMLRRHLRGRSGAPDRRPDMRR